MACATDVANATTSTENRMSDLVEHEGGCLHEHADERQCGAGLDATDVLHEAVGGVHGVVLVGVVARCDGQVLAAVADGQHACRGVGGHDGQIDERLRNAVFDQGRADLCCAVHGDEAVEDSEDHRQQRDRVHSRPDEEVTVRDRVSHDVQDLTQGLPEQTAGRGRLVVFDVRQLSGVGRDFDEGRARLLHVVLVAHRAVRVGAGRVGLGLVVVGAVHEFRGGLRAGTDVVAVHVAVGLGPVLGGQVARLVLGPKVHRVGFRVDLSVDVADGTGAGVLELLALRHGVSARSDVSRVVALEVRVAAVADEVRGVTHAVRLGAELGAVEVGVPGIPVDALTRLRRAVLMSVGGDDSGVQVADEHRGNVADDGVELRVVGHVIAFSVSGLSTERIGRTARGKQTRCLSGAVR